MHHEAPWLAALLVVAYGPLFYLLDAQPLHLWDEAFTARSVVRPAVESVHMNNNC